MKRQIAIGAVLFLLAIMALPAYGQGRAIKVNVPFNFTLTDKTYSAGEYVFTSTTDNILQMEKDGRFRLALFLADRVNGRNDTAQVRFQCYDSVCFLSQIWIPGVDGGFAPHRSRGEAEVAARSTGKYVSLLGTIPQR